MLRLNELSVSVPTTHRIKARINRIFIWINTDQLCIPSAIGEKIIANLMLFQYPFSPIIQIYSLSFFPARNCKGHQWPSIYGIVFQTGVRPDKGTNAFQAQTHGWRRRRGCPQPPYCDTPKHLPYLPMLQHTRHVRCIAILVHTTATFPPCDRSTFAWQRQKTFMKDTVTNW